MKTSLAAGLLAGLALAATAAAADDAALERARQLLDSTILIDGHNDLPWALRSDAKAQGNVDAYDLRTRTPGQTDLERLRQGRVGAQFWSVYIPSELRGGFARTQLEQIDLARRIIARYPEDLQLSLTAADVVAARQSKRIGSLLGMEGGHAIENSLGALRAYYDLGVRYMTLTHNSHNDWADSATDMPARHGGLAPFGEDVVREMNRLGMLVDLSHTSPETMQDALRVTRAPVIFSHSAARALCDVPRNVPDDVLRLLPKNGGVVMVAFVAPFVNQEVADVTGPLMVKLIAQAREAKSEEEVEKLYKDAFRDIRLPSTPISKVADHIEHIRKVAGVEHIGLGSDFDGNDYWPQGLQDVAGFPNLFAELIRRGWQDRELKMLAGENVLRAMRRAEAVAAQMRNEPTPAAVRPGFSALPACHSLPAGEVTHSQADEGGGKWRSLFDGKTTRGWRGFDSEAIPRPWRVENGALTLDALKPGESVQDRGDIVSEAEFANFELRLQWAVEPGANSGIFFFARQGAADRIWKTAPEMQVLDDARHTDGALPSHRAGALYDIYAPKCNALKPAGEYNDARLVVRNGRVEHWLNDYRIVDYELDSADFRTRVAASKFRDQQEFAKVRRGRLGLQDHGDVVRFRSIRVREL
jgi:membrane dipeptidase